MDMNRLTIKNATKPLEIEILPVDVKKGETKDPSACAIAQACLRLPNVSQARVHISTTYLQIGNKWMRYRTPGALRDEIISFDRGTGFHPGEYWLAPIQPSHRANGKRQGSGKKPKVARANPRPKHIVTGIRHNANVK